MSLKLLSSTTLQLAADTIVVSNIPQTGRDLVARVVAPVPFSNDAGLFFTMNTVLRNSSGWSGQNYEFGAGVPSADSFVQSSLFANSANLSDTNSRTVIEIEIKGYTQSTAIFFFESNFYMQRVSGVSGTGRGEVAFIRSPSETPGPITSITFSRNGGTYPAGTTLNLYARIQGDPQGTILIT